MIRAILASLAVAASVGAQEPYLIVTSEKTFISYPVDGKPVVKTLSELRVIDWTDTQPPTERDEPESELPQLSLDVAKWAEDIGNKESAQRYAVIFLTARQALERDIVSPAEVLRVIADASDAVLDDSWAPFRTKLTAYNRKQTELGKLSTKPQLLNHTAMVRAGLDKYGGGSITADEGIRVALIVNDIIRRVNEQ